jgi:putative MATE family efflux protein
MNKMSKRNVLDDDRIGNLLFRLATPAFFSSFVMMMYNIINTIFVSRYVGPLGIAGLSIVFPLQMFSMGIGQMTGMGGASYISRMIGAHDLPRAEKVLGNAFMLSAALALVITLVGLLKADFWLRFMGSSDTILPYARDYFGIILAGNVISTLVMTASALLIAEGNVRISMTGMIAGALTNIVLCTLFIIPLGWGVKGSALATVVAQIVTALYYLWYYLKQKTFLKILAPNLLLEWGIVKGILTIGIASFVRTLAGSLSAVVVNRFLMTYGGDLELSAFGLINRVMMFAIMPGQVIGQGLQPILGFNYGARRYERVIKAIWIGIIASTVWSVLAFIVLCFFPAPIVAVFTSDPELTKLTVEAARLVFFGLYVVGFMNIGSVIFQSLGKAVPAFVTALARPALFLIPLVFLLSHFLELKGVWLAFPVTDVLSALLVLVFLIPLMRQLQRTDHSNNARVEAPSAAHESKAREV